MGWNSWNHFAGRVTEADVRATADLLVSTGMRDAGYIYVNIDDTWEGKRDAQGVIQSNEKFPDMKALADYVHSKGLKLGIYSSPGPKTCAGYEGSYGHEEQDAQTYANWGIDYLKYDLCSMGKIMSAQSPNDPIAQAAIMRTAYEKMHQALLKSGRPIVYSLCQYGKDDVWKWGPQVGGNAWRTTGDIRDAYSSMSQIGFSQFGLSHYAAPGHWNDPDMLEVGNGGMTDDEYRTHFSLWALLAAPLLAGNDLSKMSPTALAILTNRDVIAIDQDSLGHQADRAWAKNATEIWTRPLAGDATAIGIFNRGNDPATVSVTLAELGLHAPLQTRDLWSKKESMVKTNTLHVDVPAHGVVLLRVVEKK
ncbi:MAG TPA: glycoside hydrolase family 27 protein [Acidobacteriaceae bacterium]